MKYQEFIENFSFGDFTAFVYDSANCRYQYSSGEITDDTFAFTTSQTEFQIVGIDAFPAVKEVIIDNFLPEIAPAPGIEDYSYEEIKDLIESGRAELAVWDETHREGGRAFFVTNFMLILNPGTYDVVFHSDNADNSKGWHESYSYCKAYIEDNNGTDESYFADYRGGIVAIYCHETGEEVYQEVVR
jgi:hypothetical protein